MSSDVVLTSALRSNLLSLQSTQSLIDRTQLRLATGLEVNSALDNPQNFFTSQSLNNRASDLSRLLDGIGQSIRTIEAADSGITGLTALAEQASSIVQSARDELAASEGEARITGSTDLRDTGTGDLIADTSIADGDVLRIVTTDNDGAQITQDVAINTGDTAASFAANITNAFADNENGEITAQITDEGFLSIESTDGRSFRLTTTAANELDDADLTALGINEPFEIETRTGGGTAVNGATIVAGNTLTSISLFESSGNVAEAGDLIGAGYTDAAGNTAISALTAGDTLQIAVNDGGTVVTSTAVTDAASFQDFVDSINQDANLNELVEASFDTNTGQLSITALNDDVRNVEIIATTAAAETVSFGFGDPDGNLDPLTTGAGAEDTVYAFNSSTEALDALAADYNTLRAQIDDLVNDAQYRGINLLNGDDLTTFFNENNTSSLITEGQVFTAAGLGLNEATFRSSAEIEETAVQARDALSSVRSFGSSLANNLSIIQTRQTFTQETINTLQAGADDLVVADQNEEGANLLALQTRQALGVTALSLAAQSQQSVLSLF